MELIDNVTREFNSETGEPVYIYSLDEGYHKLGIPKKVMCEEEYSRSLVVIRILNVIHTRMKRFKDANGYYDSVTKIKVRRRKDYFEMFFINVGTTNKTSLHVPIPASLEKVHQVYNRLRYLRQQHRLLVAQGDWNKTVYISPTAEPAADYEYVGVPEELLAKFKGK